MAKFNTPNGESKLFNLKDLLADLELPSIAADKAKEATNEAGPPNLNVPAESNPQLEADKGLDSVLTGLFTTLFQGPPQPIDGVSTFGDFDPFQFVDSHVRRGMGDDSGGFAKFLGGLSQIFGG